VDNNVQRCASRCSERDKQGELPAWRTVRCTQRASNGNWNTSTHLAPQRAGGTCRRCRGRARWNVTGFDRKGCAWALKKNEGRLPGPRRHATDWIGTAMRWSSPAPTAGTARRRWPVCWR